MIRRKSPRVKQTCSRRASISIVTNVSKVAGRLREIEASAPRSDGVVCFARLYREVTEGVAVQLDARTFENNGFVEALDLRFADLFFAAHAAYARNPREAPRAWLPLFERRGGSAICPIQVADGGVNQHITRNL